MFSNFIPIFPGCEGTARRENYANAACLQFQQLFEIAISMHNIADKETPLGAEETNSFLPIRRSPLRLVCNQSYLSHTRPFVRRHHRVRNIHENEFVYLPSQDFELDFRVGFSSQDFFAAFFWRFFLVAFPIHFRWFYTTYFVSTVAHRLEVSL